MKEPEELAQHLKNRLKRKREELLSKKFNSHTIGFLKNREEDIAKFEKSISSASKDPTLKTAIISNYMKEFNKIEQDISSSQGAN